MDIQAGINTLVDLLKGAGLEGSYDNQKLNAPCFFVHPGDINARDLGDGYTMTAQITLIARNTSQAGNLQSLQELLTAALTVLEPDGPIETDHLATVAGQNLPAFTFPCNIDI